MASRKKDPITVWEYVDWLYNSNRLTAEEHLKLKAYLIEMENKLELVIENEGC